MSLITAFVITHQATLYKTSDDNLIAAYYYVAYRTPFPDESTVERVNQQLQSNNIDIHQLTEWQRDGC
jgi:hypothetical protein